ncbi:MAG: transcriptional repressor [Aquabacterium sp.]|nr:transcriptional repressor [Aquabacterium sp.]
MWADIAKSAVDAWCADFLHTPQRAAILAAIARAGRPLLPQEVLELAATEAPTLSIATVYRALKKLSDEGDICPVALAGEPMRYEPAGREHHHHFQCRGCRRVYDVPGCVGGSGGLVPTGFTLEEHEVILYGRCASCAVPGEGRGVRA